MIELCTGVPGSGKTLGMVERLAKLFGRWEKHPEEARPVFVLGIPDLKFPVSPVPLVSVQVYKAGPPQLVPDWDLMPDGSLVMIDEAQGCFPPRASGSMPPAHVAWLNVHRHRGFDIWLTTQHPKLIDASVRALVGKHLHYRRLFGGSRACVYEWDACSDSLGGMKTAVKSYWPYPKKAFAWYKSAEIHTKQRFKIPLWIWIPLIGILMGLYFVPRAGGIIINGASGKGLGAHAKAAPVETVKLAAGGAGAGAFAPGVSTVSTHIAAVEPVPPVYVGCISDKNRCVCLTGQGVQVEEPEMCVESSQGFGHLINISMASSAPVPAAYAGPSVPSIPPVSTSPQSKSAVGS